MFKIERTLSCSLGAMRKYLLGIQQRINTFWLICSTGCCTGKSGKVDKHPNPIDSSGVISYSKVRPAEVQGDLQTKSKVRRKPDKMTILNKITAFEQCVCHSRHTAKQCDLISGRSNTHIQH